MPHRGVPCPLCMRPDVENFLREHYRAAMSTHSHKHHRKQIRTCIVCGTSENQARLVPVSSLRPPLAALIARQEPVRWHEHGAICQACLNRCRVRYTMSRLQEERGELTAVEADIARKAGEHAFIAEHIGEALEQSSTLGQRVADAVARVGGSWGFVIPFLLLLLGWMALNSLLLTRAAFDPYPYILLNLVLSSLAALQAPIIMMSQNRTAARDRAQADQDYRVNLKAEIEIASLHEKVDHLLHTQWERLVELQEIQLDLLTELAESDKRPPLR